VPVYLWKGRTTAGEIQTGELTFDSQDEVLACPSCGHEKCTRACMPNPTEPCVDCKALEASPDEGGYDAAATNRQRLARAEVDGARALGARLFDGKFRPDPKAVAEAAEEGSDSETEESE